MIRSTGRLRSLPRRADGPAAFRALRRYRLRGSISPEAVQAIAGAIQTQEGYYPGSLAYQNNNPGNLVYAGQSGAVPGAGGFAKFNSYQAGETALENQITLDAVRGTDINGNPTTTLSQFLTSYAPPSENDTSSYITAVSNQTGYDPNAPLSSLGAPGVTGTAAAPIDLAPGVSDSTFSTAGLLPDLSSLSDSVDLSSVGIDSSVPVGVLLAAGLVVAIAVFRR